MKMHITCLVAAVAALGLGVHARPALPATCSYVMSEDASGRAKCEGTLATFKKGSPGVAAQLTAVAADVSSLRCPV